MASTVRRRGNQRACALVVCSLPLLMTLPIWIAVALCPRSPAPVTAWPLPRALLSALALSSAPSTAPTAGPAPTSTAAPSAVPALPQNASAPSAAPLRPVRHAPPARCSPLHREIVDPWGGS